MKQAMRLCGSDTLIERTANTDYSFQSQMSILVQKRLFYNDILHSETPGDSKNVVLRLGDLQVEGTV